MIHIVRATDLWKVPKLAAGMFEDRRRQFFERLGWPVDVDIQGYERDEYDSEDPVYIIVEDQNGQHAGSMRFLPTTGRTMISDHFKETLKGIDVTDLRVWECTRFCLAPGQNRQMSRILIAIAARFMEEAELTGFVSIFDAPMERVYRRLGLAPTVLGAHNYSGTTAIAGYWSFNSNTLSNLLKGSGIDQVELELAIVNFKVPWLEQSAA